MTTEANNTCPLCGGTNLMVTHNFIAEWEVTWTLTCICGHEEQQKKKLVRHLAMEYECGRLNGDQEIEWREWSRRRGTTEGIETDGDPLPPKCSCWHGPAVQGEPVIESRTDTWGIECGDCAAHPLFAWSKPGRKGKLWIASSPDFDEWMVWPDGDLAHYPTYEGWFRDETALPTVKYERIEGDVRFKWSDDVAFSIDETWKYGDERGADVRKGLATGRYEVLALAVERRHPDTGEYETVQSVGGVIVPVDDEKARRAKEADLYTGE